MLFQSSSRLLRLGMLQNSVPLLVSIAGGGLFPGLPWEGLGQGGQNE